MSLRIEDGTGSGKEAAVNSNHRLEVHAVTSQRGAIVARENQRTFLCAFEDATAAAGEYLAYLQNTSTTRVLIVDKVRVSSTNAATWKLWKVTGTAAGAGTDPTPLNTNFSSGITAEANVEMEAITGLTVVGTVGEIIRNAANAAAAFDVDDTIVLGVNDALAIEYDTGTTGPAGCTMRFHYEDIDE